MISVALIALQPLRAGVPADDEAVEADHVDGVIDNAVDEELQAPGIF